MRRLGEQILHIRLDEHLGTGGMGDIFVGFDTKLDRRVAVKAIRPECLSTEVHERLVREARLLSSLDHESICRIYELLEHEGEVFLILELIRGQNLRQALDAELRPSHKLEIAEKILTALEAAHRSGIIHRDLKLENVMLRDDGAVKVLDFGVARSVHAAPPPTPPESVQSESAEQTTPAVPKGFSQRRDSSLTLLGEAVGTVATMSPEQARGEVVTPATDLYSLGLLLQELFTGASPYPEGLEDEVLWLRVREGDTLPARLADRELTELVEEMKSPSAADRPATSEVIRRLRALMDRPRRRLRLAAALLMLALIVTAAGKYTYDLRHERNAAIEARGEAEARQKESEAVLDFVVGLFEASDPAQARGRDPLASEILERGVEKARDALPDQPLARARLMAAIGQVSRLLGQNERAESFLADALETRLEHQEPGHAEIARSRADLGDVLRLLGRFEEAKSHLEDSLANLQDGEDQSRLLGDVHNRLGAIALDVGDLEVAAKHFETVVEWNREGWVSSEHLAIAARSNLGVVYLQLGRLEAAATEQEKALEMRRRLFGADHPTVGNSLNNLAVVRYSQGDLEAAEASLSQALAIWQKVYGEQHPEVATATSNLGELALARGELDVAEARFERALTIWRSAFSDEHPDLAYAWHGLGHVARQRDHDERARTAYSEALRLRRAFLAEDHPDLLQTQKDLASLGG